MQNKTQIWQAMEAQSIQQEESGLENALNYAIFEFYAVSIQIKLIIIKISLKKHGKNEIRQFFYHIPLRYDAPEQGWLIFQPF